MKITSNDLEALERVILQQNEARLEKYRRERPPEKEAFNMAAFLAFTFGEKFGRTPLQLETSYYTSFKDLHTMEEFATAMTQHMY